MTDQPYDRNHLEAALWVVMTLVILMLCLALRCTLDHATVPNARDRTDVLFHTRYSRRWFAKSMEAAGYFNFIGVIMRITQTEYDPSCIFFRNARLLDPPAPLQGGGDIIGLHELLGDQVYGSGAGLPVAYLRSPPVNNVASSPDDNVETVQDVIPVPG
ncbi:hypothetical protein BDQ17DRAFT_1321709 [Cyathus striatus]|nr:hypothetical protein BDQ17DRAFT_1321709 [Cyathus striatus]